MHGEVSARPERLPDDGDFLLSLYGSTRRPELTGLGWPETEVDAFVRMQFGAQARHYRESFPDAAYSVICVDGEPVGRLIINRADDEIVIVDITLVPEFRRIGVGGRLVRRLLDEADAARLRVRCHVREDSDARRFWERAGFTEDGSDGVYVAMDRAPRPGRSDRRSAPGTDTNP
jgi:GNAT superfamily N-acetyltransferase